MRPMPLVFFPVTGQLQAVVSDASDPAGEPDIENISSFVYFTPSVDQVFHATDQIIYRLPTVRGRTNARDGKVVNIDDTPMSLVANTPAMELESLTYLVTFDHVRYDQQKGAIRAFRFEAPPDATPVDLATVDRLPA